MEGRSPEFSPNIPENSPTTPEQTDDGFSEAKSARAVEGKGMDTKQAKKRKPIILGTNRLIRPVRTTRPARQANLPAVEQSRKQKIVIVYKENSSAIVKLVELLDTIDGANFRQEEQIIAEIKERRHLQEDLLHALILEQRNQLTEDAISKEAWNLIK